MDQVRQLKKNKKLGSSDCHCEDPPAGGYVAISDST
jgi:hypothetical protein